MQIRLSYDDFQHEDHSVITHYAAHRNFYHIHTLLGNDPRELG